LLKEIRIVNYSLQEDKCLGDSRAMLEAALPADEAHLIELCLNGDQPARKQLYDEYCDRLYRLMYRMVGHAHADDLTQQVFLCVFHKLNKFQHRSTFATWLFRVANYAAQFSTDVLLAQQRLIVQYSGRKITADEAFGLVGNRPANVKLPPADFTCDSLYFTRYALLQMCRSGVDTGGRFWRCDL